LSGEYYDFLYSKYFTCQHRKCNGYG